MSYAYAVVAMRRKTTPDGWTGTHPLPTFYLFPEVQGIVDAAHAERIARDILGPVGEGESLVLDVVRVDR